MIGKLSGGAGKQKCFLVRLRRPGAWHHACNDLLRSISRRPLLNVDLKHYCKRIRRQRSPAIPPFLLASAAPKKLYSDQLYNFASSERDSPNEWLLCANSGLVHRSK
jgi:hypothetical protein